MRIHPTGLGTTLVSKFALDVVSTGEDALRSAIRIALTGDPTLAGDAEGETYGFMVANLVTKAVYHAKRSGDLSLDMIGHRMSSHENAAEGIPTLMLLTGCQRRGIPVSMFPARLDAVSVTPVVASWLRKGDAVGSPRLDFHLFTGGIGYDPAPTGTVFIQPARLYYSK